MDVAVEYVGLLASVGSLTLWWPQAVRLWRQRHDAVALVGLSITTQVVLLATETLWAAYALLTASYWVGVPAMVNIPLSVLAIRLLRRARRAPSPAAPMHRHAAERRLERGHPARMGR